MNWPQSTGSSCGLPGWLLTCQQIPDEGLEQFRRRATWIIWPVFTDGSYSPDFGEMLMASKFARSIAMPRLACENSNWGMYSPLVVDFLYFSFREVDANWLLNFAESLRFDHAIVKLSALFFVPGAGFWGTTLVFQSILALECDLWFSTLVRLSFKNSVSMFLQALLRTGAHRTRFSIQSGKTSRRPCAINISKCRTVETLSTA